MAHATALSPCCHPTQNPEAADKLAKIQRDLDETKIILHKTIESVLDRGEKLDQVRAGQAKLALQHMLAGMLQRQIGCPPPLSLSSCAPLPPVLLQLVDKSADLSMASQLFYKQARKANSCCRFM